MMTRLSAWLADQWSKRAPALLGIIGTLCVASILSTSLLAVEVVKLLGEHTKTLQTTEGLQANVNTLTKEDHRVISKLPASDKDILEEVYVLNYNENVICKTFNLPCLILPTDFLPKGVTVSPTTTTTTTTTSPPARSAPAPTLTPAPAPRLTPSSISAPAAPTAPPAAPAPIRGHRGHHH